MSYLSKSDILVSKIIIARYFSQSILFEVFFIILILHDGVFEKLDKFFYLGVGGGLVVVIRYVSCLILSYMRMENVGFFRFNLKVCINYLLEIW
jgi:hypothetical protein